MAKRTMDDMAIYRVFNAGEIPHLAHGTRCFVAKRGRKFVSLVDPTTLKHAKVPLPVWDKLYPEEARDYSPRKCLRTMKARLKYVTKTKAIREAMTLVGG